MSSNMVDENENRTGFEIAVIGMACRFPGAETVDQLWENLKNGRESVTFFTREELLEAGVSPALAEHRDYVAAGINLERKDYFDAHFFGYTPREVHVMDPQMRIMHEVTWEALENAGYDPDTYDQLIGFYMGAAPSFKWEAAVRLSGDSDAMGEFQSSLFSNRDYISTHVSYRLNLRGPSFTMQTACSTSLVSIDLACRGLLTGQCSIALAGGVKITPGINAGYLYREGMILSPDGHCRAFDAKAQGTIGGEGAAVVVLKPLDDAMEHGDHIEAVIIGTAVNNDGRRKVGFTAPSVTGQAEVIAAALHMAEIEAGTISYVETHGTGTPLGDPIEIQALSMAFGVDDSGGTHQKYPIGAIKTNLGHTDSAAGAAGFIKTVLILKHRLIPPTLHFETPNPAIDFQNSPFYINSTVTPLENRGCPLRAGISSFGIGGTNAHIILEAAPDINDYFPSNTGNDTGEPELLLLSARTPEALERMKENLGNAIFSGSLFNSTYTLADVAFTLQAGRKSFEYRAMATVGNLEEASAILLGENEGKRRLYRFGPAIPDRPVMFVFPGLGGQYVNMGKGLYDTREEFKEPLDRCFGILDSLLGIRCRDILYPGPGDENAAAERLNRPEYLQPLLFSFQYALGQMLITWGIRPQSMIGYSFGEYAAACFSGVMSLEDAVTVIVKRGRLVNRTGSGAMLSIPLTREQLEPVLEPHSQLALAIDNGPSCIAAGPVEAIETFELELKQKRLMTFRIPSAHAIHTPMMNGIADEFRLVMEGIELSSPGIPFISNVTGTWITDEQAVDPDYWRRHLTGTVEFGRGVRESLNETGIVFIEVGPGRDLSALINRAVADPNDHPVVNLIRSRDRDVSDWDYLLTKTGWLWLFGVSVDWQEFRAGQQVRRVPLPTYPFQRVRFPIKELDVLVKKFMGRQPAGTVAEEAQETAEATTGESADNYQRPPLSSDYKPAQTPVEKVMTAIWEDIFGFAGIGVNDDFFELRGDSLKAMIVLARIQDRLGADIPLPEFFKTPTISELSSRIPNSGSRRTGGIGPVEKREYYPVSPAQKRMFIIKEMDPDSTGYNLPQVMFIGKGFDVDRLERVVNGLIERHESLRTSFFSLNEEPVQRIHDPVDIDFHIEYSGCGPGRGGEPVDISELGNITRDFIRPFDLFTAPLLRICIVGSNDGYYRALTDMHHIVSDGTSLQILERDFNHLIRGLQLPELPVQYKDFAMWQTEPERVNVLEAQEEYWLSEFSGDIPVLELPLDFPRPRVQAFDGDKITFYFNRQELDNLNALASRLNCTLYMVLMAAYSLVLGKLAGTQEVIAGTVTAGRRLAALEQMIGMFINTLAIRTAPAREKTIPSFLAEIKEKILTAFDNQDYPFENLVEKVSVRRDLGRSPIFDVLFTLQSQVDKSVVVITAEKSSEPGSQSKKHDAPAMLNPISKYDITMIAFEGEDGLMVDVEYSAGLFKPETMQRFAGYYRSAAMNMAGGCGETLGEIDIIGEEERHDLLVRFNDTDSQYPEDKTIFGLFHDQASKTPEAPAVIYRDRIVSYRELDRRSDALSGVLTLKGVISGSPVAVRVDDPVNLAVSLFGVMKAGGAYLPIDSTLPTGRIAYMMADSAASLVVCELGDTCTEAFSSTNSEIRCIPVDGQFSVNSGPCPEADPGQTAYIIYTSGTTGNPKGVAVSHRGAVNTLWHRSRDYRLDAETVSLQLFSYSFDGFVTAFFTPFVLGGQVVMLNRSEIGDLDTLKNTIIQKCVTHFISVPALFAALVGQMAPSEMVSLKTVTLAGDKIYPQILNDVRQKAPQLEIAVEYGVTEAAVMSTIHRNQQREETVKIGHPTPNTRIYILDPGCRLQPVGTAGELHIAGAGVANGYLNNPQLTSERFGLAHNLLRHPHREKREENPDGFVSCRGKMPHTLTTLYHTGDLARWLICGNIEFLGRVDFQVKIRGFRIEIEEIEARLLEHEYVSGAVVVDRMIGGERQLCAYVILAKNIEISVLTDFLGVRLPEYMIPGYFTVLEELPKTVSGKIDRRALPEPGNEVQDVYTPPRNSVERELVRLWTNVLKIDTLDIGIHTSFFQLGGHSLKAAILAAEIFKTFNIKIPVIEIFLHPTIALIARFIDEAGTVADGYEAIEAAEEKEYYPMSPAQKRMFFIQALDPMSTGYNMPRLIPVDRDASRETLDRVFMQLLDRHEILRTSFRIIDDQPVQEVHAAGSIAPAWEENAVREKVVDYESLTAEFEKPFDLSLAPLFRLKYIKGPGPYRYILIDMHHIITDGTSQDLLEKEFAALYSGYELPVPPLQYKDYSLWRAQERQKATVASQAEYWLKEFSGPLPVLNLPADFPRPVVQGFAGSSVDFFLDHEQVRELRRLADSVDATWYMTLLSVFTVLLSRLSGQDDIIVGTPVAARGHADLQRIIGMFVNTLAIRNYLSPEKTVIAYLTEVKERVLSALDNQDYQFDDMVEDLSLPRDTGRNPVFDVMFNLLNQTEYKGSVPAEHVPGTFRHRRATAKFDLNVTAVQLSDGFLLNVEYSTALFKPETIERFICYFMGIVSAFSSGASMVLGDIQIITDAEKEVILKRFNDTAQEFPGIEYLTVDRWFREQAARTPGSEALVWTGSIVPGRQNQPASYRWLDSRSNQLARRLRETGVTAGAIVGLMADRSVELIVAMVAILKAGGAYLPIDPEYPAERIEFMLRDSRIRVMVIGTDNTSIPWEGDPELEIVNLSDENIYNHDDFELEPVNCPADLLYMIYTSGSTGQPKGVLLEHRNLVNLMAFQFYHTSIDFSSVLQFTTISFDVSFQEIFSTLLSGGTLYLIENRVRDDVTQLLELIDRYRVKTLFLPASYLKFILNEERFAALMPGCVDHIVTAGEQLIVTPRFRRYLREEKVYLHNHYGPSETHVVTAFTMAPGDEIPDLPPIGGPVANTSIYILDTRNQIVPIGVAGELVIGGIQVGRGYFEADELTETKFVPDPFTPGGRMYRTGDLARWTAEGVIEFLGRLDFQVKIRGFRVEPGEIENRLLSFAEIKETTVQTLTDDTGGYFLCCYYTAVEDTGMPVTGSELRLRLREQLPDYMVPSFFVPMARIPLTPNGKVDRRALPRPIIEKDNTYAPPNTYVEIKLVKIWADVLGIDQETVSIDADFFEIGGHSLRAAILVTKIHKELEARIPLSDIFRDSTIRTQAAAVEKRIKEEGKQLFTQVEAAEEQEYYRATPMQKQLFILNAIEGIGVAYNFPDVKAMKGDVDRKRLETAFHELIHRHDSLRACFDVVNGETVMFFRNRVDFRVEYFDASHKPGRVDRLIRDFVRPFDLTRAPLLRAGLIKVSLRETLLLFDTHHIISDGTSLSILLRDLQAFYKGNVDGMPTLRAGYRDFIMWNRYGEGRKVIERSEFYWLEQYKKLPPAPGMYTDFPRPDVQSFDGDALAVLVEPPVAARIMELVKETGTTLYMVLLAAYSILLGKYSGQEDIVVGTPVAGRDHADLHNIIGLFINTLPMRAFPSREKSFLNFLKEVKENTLAAFENQAYPFAQLLEKLDITREISRNPLFEAELAVQNVEVTELNVEGVAFESRGFEFRKTQMDISLHIYERAGVIQGVLSYSTQLFKRETMESFISHFNHILNAVTTDTGIYIGDIKFPGILEAIESGTSVHQDDDDGFGF